MEEQQFEQPGQPDGVAPRPSEDLFRLLVEGVRDYAILALDVDGRIISWNPGAQLIKGYRPEEILGRHFSTFYEPADLAAEVPEMELIAAAADGRFEAEGWRLRKDGSRFWAHVVISALFDDQHVLRGFGKVTKDITDARRRAQELAEASEALKTANDSLRRQAAELSSARDAAELAMVQADAATRAKSTFLATMSHEIRTPMNAVIGMSGLLLDTELDPVQRDYLNTILTSGDALLAIINDVLDYSKIESGELELDSAPFVVRDLIEAALDLVSAQAGHRGLELLADLDDSCPPYLLGDVTRLRQVLVNLLTNAVKFTPAGSVMVTVATEEADDGQLRLRVAVIDSGIGIPADRMDRLFRSFSQVEASTTRSYGGTGLGLAISARLVEAMGGEIAVHSEPGHGSTFTFGLPVSRAERPAETHRAGPESLRGLHALVVDDNADNRRILQRQLAAWGTTSDTADGAAAALRLAARGRRYDVGVLDLDMPAMDGIDLAVALHGLPRYADLPLVLLSSVCWQPSAGDSRHFAAQLVKPAKVQQLHRALTRAVVLPVPEGAREEPDAATPPSPLRILLVEDNTVNRKIALLMLQRLGYAADTAGNGREALAAVHATGYDIVLMDVQMPDMDGLEASRRIRAELPSPRQPTIIALTADAMAEDRSRCLQAGMDDYLAKPVRLKQLAATLEGRVPGPRVARRATAGD